MQRYNPKEIEPKWQATWEQDKIYQATDDPGLSKKYILEYFPYPSGAAMHVGHVRNYTIGDAWARFNRMNGHNVLHPMGWDAFGLPAENYAIKTGVTPRQAIDTNTQRFKKQLVQMGFGYDWSREIDSTDPKYYRWTQWFFLLLFKKGLAYQQESLQWWCPFDKTVLANEQVENGRCWRCGHVVEKKALKQWFFKITAYADRLLHDLDNVNWSDAIKAMQRNWIGRSQGAEIEFQVEGSEQTISVFTTRADTIFSAAFLVLAPEHSIVSTITTDKHSQVVSEYIRSTQSKSDIERQETNRVKTGAFTGAYAVNPANQEKIPIWISDFVLAGYGTGAVFGDIHDERDFQFIEQFQIPARVTVVPDNEHEAADVKAKKYPYTGEGILIDSEQFSGQRSEEARDKIVAWLATKGAAKKVVNYKIRDWLISRQRYWGAPIPIIHCPKDGVVPVPEDQLPVLLPDLTEFEPSGDGRSPLAKIETFVQTTCPTCGGAAERETDTMDGFACSSWYFLRFADPHNDMAAFDRKLIDYWLPVDDYIGGAEHAVMHLLYARFWIKVMFDDGLIGFEEPFLTLRNQGMILAPDGQKMSKSKGNTIEPDGLIEQGYGADSIRIMELFIGPWNQAANWSVEGMGGAHRFLQRVWILIQEYMAANKSHQPSDKNQSQTQIEFHTHQTIKKVSRDVRELSLNTAIASLMSFVNDLYKLKEIDHFESDRWQFALQSLLQLLAPFAPHITEELWHQLGNETSIHLSQWPAYDEKLLVQATTTIVIQVNGKLRGQINLPLSSTEADVMAEIKKQPHINSYIDSKEIIKTVYVNDKLLSIVVTT